MHDCTWAESEHSSEVSWLVKSDVAGIWTEVWGVNTDVGAAVERTVEDVDTVEDTKARRNVSMAASYGVIQGTEEGV